VQVLFLVIAFYAALWFTVVAASGTLTSFWKFLSFLPAMLICMFFFYIVKTAALLKAVHVVDTDVMLEVIEETEAAKQLSEDLRARVLERLDETGEDPFDEIERLYNEIDVNNSDSLSRREFGQFMELMGISFSMKKWESIYKEIDRNYDNEISLNEFLLFLYPTHDEALMEENNRLSAISQRVMTRANHLLQSSFTPLNVAVGVVASVAATVGSVAADVTGAHHLSHSHSHSQGQGQQTGVQLTRSTSGGGGGSSSSHSPSSPGGGSGNGSGSGSGSGGVVRPGAAVSAAEEQRIATIRTRRASVTSVLRQEQQQLQLARAASGGRSSFLEQGGYSRSSSGAGTGAAAMAGAGAGGGGFRTDGGGGTGSGGSGGGFSHFSAAAGKVSASSLERVSSVSSSASST
jgi:hypothetical protein